MHDLSVTRYFSFVRVNPRDEDFELLVKVADSIRAYIGYGVSRVVKNGRTRVIMKGFIVLHGSPTSPSRLVSWFPNFLLRSSRRSSFRFPGSVTVIGQHPFDEIRKDLFNTHSFY